jgi:hypothetical protein
MRTNRTSTLRSVLLAMTLVIGSVMVLHAVAVSEDWNGCADALNNLDCDLDWTIQTTGGDLSIESNILVAPTNNSYTQAIATPSTTFGDDQYIGATAVVCGNSAYPAFFFRFSNGSSSYNEVILKCNENAIDINVCPATNMSCTSNYVGPNDQLTIDDGDEIGATVTGSGTSTIFRIWRNWTGLPSSVSNWNGASAALELDIDPTTVVNTGSRIGIGGYRGSFGYSLDNVVMGDFAGGGPPPGGPSCRMNLLGIRSCSP